MKDHSLLDSRILIVDDQELNVLLLQRILEDNGYTNLRTLTDSRQVISQGEAFQPDLILLDLMMPQLDGYQVMEKLNAILPPDSYLPILVLTADIRAEAKQRALALGAKDFLTKPFNQVEVLLRIQNLLKTRQLHLQLQSQNQILEQKVAERTAELASQSHLLELYFKHTISSLAILDRDFNFIRVNEAYARSDERQVSDFPGHNHFEFYPSDAQAIFEQVVMTKKPYQTFAHPFVYADHPERGITYWDWTLAPVLDADGEVELLIFSLNNVTERKQAETALRASDERFSRLVAQMNDVVWSAPMDGSHILDVNEAFERVYGISADEFRANPSLWIEMAHPKDRKIAEASAQELFEKGRTSTEYRILRPDGKERWILDRKSLLYDEQGNPVQMGGIAHDITERKRAEEALQQRARELQTLYETSLEINAQTSLDALLSSIVERSASLLDTGSGGLYQMEPDGKSLKLAVCHNLPEEFIGLKLAIGEGLSGQVAQSGKPMYVDDYQTWTGRTKVYDGTSFRRMLGIPLKIKEIVIGVINVSDLTRTGSFTEDQVQLVTLFADQAALAIESARLREQAERHLRRTEALHTIDIAITGSMDINVIFNIIFDQAFAQLGMDAIGVLLFDPGTQRLEYAAGRGFRTESLQHTRLPLGEGYAGRAALGRKTIHISELQNRKTDFLRSPTFSQEEFVSYYGVPLVAKGQIKGVLEIFHRKAFEAEAEWLDFLETLAGQMAIAIDNADLFKDLQLSNIELSMAYDATIEGWSHAMDLRDKETQDHTLRVTQMTEGLARTLGIGDSDLVHIRRGALLHDIGKMGVPDSVLLKAGKLTDEEWELMRRHPQFAYDMLSPISYLRPAMDIPYCHHEKWDGTGYPRGLKGEQIPLAARLFAVVDVYDALTSDRPYRKAWSKKKTLEYIKEQSGTHFDPKVVERFLQMMKERQEEQ